MIGHKLHAADCGCLVSTPTYRFCPFGSEDSAESAQISALAHTCLPQPQPMHLSSLTSIFSVLNQEIRDSDAADSCLSAPQSGVSLRMQALSKLPIPSEAGTDYQLF